MQMPGFPARMPISCSWPVQYRRKVTYRTRQFRLRSRNEGDGMLVVIPEKISNTGKTTGTRTIQRSSSMKFPPSHIPLLLFIIASPVIHSGEKTAQNEWIMARPLALTFYASDSPNGVHCYIGLAYETDDSTKAATARYRHCTDLAGISALLRAEITDGDKEIVRIAISPNRSGMFDQIDSIIIGGIEYHLAE
jgi:hypothetical protein